MWRRSVRIFLAGIALWLPRLAGFID